MDYQIANEVRYLSFVPQVKKAPVKVASVVEDFGRVRKEIDKKAESSQCMGHKRTETERFIRVYVLKKKCMVA